MNGLFNQNFLVGMLLARDMERDKALLVGLMAGQMSPKNPVGPILVKPLLDDRAALETGKKTAETQVGILSHPLRVELPAGTTDARLRIAGVDTAKWSVEKKDGVDLVADAGDLKLADVTKDATATLVAAIDGVVRRVEVVRPKK